MSRTRRFWPGSFNSRDQRYFKETFRDLLIGLVLNPDSQLWLVSAWITDFDLLDNRSGDWSALNPTWGLRLVSFSELLATAVNGGSHLTLICQRDPTNDRFRHKIKSQIKSHDRYRERLENDTEHKKVFLSSTFEFSGSMNFTWSGTNRNDELVTLTTDHRTITDSRLYFEDRYFPS
jgi:hypothetical protein